jgi:hypothetical protein
MNTKNALYGALCGLLVFAILFWTVPKKTVRAAVLATPPEGRFELVQLHPSTGTEWSGILDTETGCTWVYATQTPPTDAEVSAAPEGEQRGYKSYQQMRGRYFFASAPYDTVQSSMLLPGREKPSTIAGQQIATLIAEGTYCDEARQAALRAAAAR